MLGGRVADSLSGAMNWLAIGLLVVVALLALANIVAYWRMRPRAADEPVYHFKCPNCNQRLRYRARQAGNPGACRRCKARWNFPPVPAAKK